MTNRILPSSGSVSREDARASSLRFWSWCNSAEGMPEHYPDEEAVRFAMRVRKRGKQEGRPMKVLDLGTGGGKHAVLIAETGSQYIGVDWSQPGLDYTRARLERHGLTGDLRCLDYAKEPLPHPDASIDAIVAIQTFDHIFDADARVLLVEAHRVLRKGGLMLASFMTDQTSKKSRTGVPVEGERLTEVVSSGNSAGEIHRFLPASEIDAFYGARFKILESSRLTAAHDQSGEVSEAKYYVLEK